MVRHCQNAVFRVSNNPFRAIAGQEEFTERDVEVFRRYLTFCGIGERIFLIASRSYLILSMINRYSECAAFWELSPGVQTQPDPAEPSEEHIWGAKQSGMLSHENNEGSEGSIEVRKMCRFPGGFRMLRGGNHWAIRSHYHHLTFSLFAFTPFAESFRENG